VRSVMLYDRSLDRLGRRITNCCGAVTLLEAKDRIASLYGTLGVEVEQVRSNSQGGPWRQVASSRKGG